MKRLWDLTSPLFILFVLFVISDIVTTYYALSMGAQETNPFVASLIEINPMIYPLMWILFILILGGMVKGYEKVTKCPGFIVMVIPILIELGATWHNVGVIWCLNGLCLF